MNTSVTISVPGHVETYKLTLSGKQDVSPIINNLLKSGITCGSYSFTVDDGRVISLLPGACLNAIVTAALYGDANDEGI